MNSRIAVRPFLAGSGAAPSLDPQLLARPPGWQCMHIDRQEQKISVSSRGSAAESSGGKVPVPLPTMADVIQLQRELLAAKDETLKVSNKLNRVRDKLEKSLDAFTRLQRKEFRSTTAQREAEIMTDEKKRELGMVGARGIIEWAEFRAKERELAWRKLPRAELWDAILEKDEELAADLAKKTGWSRRKFAANFAGLYSWLCNGAPPSGRPRESMSSGGVVLRFGGGAQGIGLSADQAKALVLVAEVNFTRAEAVGPGNKTLLATPGLGNKKHLRAFEKEEEQYNW